MNQKDLMVISELRKNARESLTRMSHKIHIPISTIYERLKFNEKQAIIKHTSLIDFAKLGFNTRANIVLKVERECRDAARDFLQKHQNINSLFKINNGFDFLIEGVFKNIKDVEEFLDNLEQKYKVSDRQVFYIIDDIKRETFLADYETARFVF